IQFYFNDRDGVSPYRIHYHNVIFAFPLTNLALCLSGNKGSCLFYQLPWPMIGGENGHSHS
uniref:Uncharacterized protein n=1 Tax=Macaca fascicularis TaxID=9541 RepID=A0A7N9ICP7_MACFA